MFKNSFMVKIITIVVLAVILLIPVAMVRELIDERTSYKQSVVEQIASNSSGAQKIIGPILAIPFQETTTEAIDPENPQKTRQVTREYVHYIIPQTLKINADAKVHSKKLGIYQAQQYNSALNFSGSFNIEEIQKSLTTKNINLLDPYFIVSISDNRGIMAANNFKLNDKEFTFKEGGNSKTFTNGIHIPLKIEDLISLDAKNKFSFELKLQGTQSLSVAPLGRDSEFALESDWKHPSFIGNILPINHKISEKGFAANWQSSVLSNNISTLFHNAFYSSENYTDHFNEIPLFSVNMIETVDEYQLNERSVKYAILFIGLTFMAFLIFETVSHVRVHPVQYTLVGFALVLFYLVLLAFSEHIGFNQAYLYAALASSILIGLYLCSVLKGIIRGLSFTIGLLALYGLLFMILQSEDFALMMGASLLFIVLAAIMLITRNIDWYELSSSLTPRKKEKEVVTPAQAVVPMPTQIEINNQEIIDQIDIDQD